MVGAAQRSRKLIKRTVLRNSKIISDSQWISIVSEIIYRRKERILKIKRREWKLKNSDRIIFIITSAVDEWITDFEKTTYVSII